MIDIFSQEFILHALFVGSAMGLLLSYLGVHVVGRGIVFVDLALGQISMLGVAFAGLIEQDPTVVAIIFTMVGAFILSFVNVRDKRLRQEAIIGIVYAVASALTVMLISKTPHGEADISEVLFGSLFTATITQISVLTIVFAAIALLHAIFRKKFFELTEQMEHHSEKHIGIFNFWNFLFYLTIGLAIVLAVRIGGVIPVFSYLIIPPVAALLLARRKSIVIIVALVLGLLANFFGVFVSVHFDFPVGSTIVAVLGAVFLGASIIRLIRKTGQHHRAIDDSVPDSGLQTRQ